MTRPMVEHIIATATSMLPRSDRTTPAQLAEVRAYVQQLERELTTLRQSTRDIRVQLEALEQEEAGKS